MRRYLDTSVLVSFVVSEIHTTDVRRGLQDTRYNNIISDWTITEFYSALSFKVRTKQISPDLKVTAEAFFNAARTKIFQTISVKRVHFRRAGDLAARPELWLRAGDALHLAIAENEDLILWTFDDRLRRAATELGVAAEST